MKTTAFSALAIDDNEDDLVLLTHLLHRAEMPLVLLAYNNGAQALASLTAKLRTQSTDLPNLVFLDHQMPGLGGLDVLQWLRREPAFDATAIVMLSSGDAPADLERAAALGAQCYVLKHPSAGEIAQIIDEARIFSRRVPGRIFFPGAYNRFYAQDLEVLGPVRVQ